MTPQELKNSVLQLAIQGKLVEQRPEEGTGEELYRQIQSEKQKLIREGKIKKEKPLPEIAEDEVPFDIPESWKWVRWGELSDSIQYGYNAAAKSSGRIKMVRISDIQDNVVLWDSVPYCDISENEIPAYRLQKNDILFARTGGTVFLVNEVPEEAIYAGYLIRTRYSSKLEPKYMKLFMESQLYWDQLKSGTIATAQPNCNGKTLSKMILPLPPLAEQKRIVAKIEDLLPLIDRYEKAWGRLEEFNRRFPADMQKSLLQMAIQGKLVEQRPEEGTGEEVFNRLMPYHYKLKPCKDELDCSSMDFEIPPNWMLVELNQLFDFVDYRGKTPNKMADGVFLITSSNIKRAYMEYSRREYISHEEYLSRQSRGITQKGDLLFTTEAPMGNAALCDMDECSCGQRIITLKEYAQGTVYPALYMYFVLSPQFQQQLLSNCTGTTAKGIKADKLKHLLLPLPPYAEQKRIVTRLEQLLPLCERLKRERDEPYVEKKHI